MKKFCAILFSFVLVLMLALPVAAEDAAGESDSLFDTAPALTAPAGYVVNLDTNIVVYEKNSETQLSAASLTKMMTALLFLESGKDMNAEITIPANLTQEFKDIQNANGSTINLRIGETVRRPALGGPRTLPRSLPVFTIRAHCKCACRFSSASSVC